MTPAVQQRLMQGLTSPAAVLRRWMSRSLLIRFRAQRYEPSTRNHVPLAQLPVGLHLLAEVALRLDEEAPTTRRDTRCLLCRGSGECEVWVRRNDWGNRGGLTRADWPRPQGSVIVAFSGNELLAAYPQDIGLPHEVRTKADRIEERWTRRAPCPDCIVNLSETVISVACMRSPLVSDWPEEWLVQIDKAEHEGDLSPRAVWWREFRLWTTVGKEPDEEALAVALDEIAKVAKRKSAEAFDFPKLVDQFAEDMRMPARLLRGEPLQTHVQFGELYFSPAEVSESTSRPFQTLGAERVPTEIRANAHLSSAEAEQLNDWARSYGGRTVIAPLAIWGGNRASWNRTAVLAHYVLRPDDTGYVAQLTFSIVNDLPAGLRP